MPTKRLVLLLLVASSTTALADDYELGARVGGYGFRRDSQQDWTECRMNGFGVFGGHALTGPLFLEAGIDMYSSVGTPQPTDLPIDRTSGLLSSAIGARTQLASWLRGYVQLGTGVELTRVSVPYGDEKIRASKVMPEGFFGIGLDIELAHATHLGSTFRALVMGNFDYDPANLDTSKGFMWQPNPDVVFAASPDVATQVQFYVRRDL